MAVKAGSILTVGNSFVVDRLQSVGPGDLSGNEEVVREVGNFLNVATVRDTPTLSFDLESFDVTPEIEALLLAQDPTTVVSGDEFDFNKSVPLDIISPFKAGSGQFGIVGGVVIPYLTLESITYRYGNRQNATKSATLRGDSLYYIPGSPYYQEFAGNGVATNFSFTHTALPYKEGGDTIHALGVDYIRSDGTSRRLFFGDDYTDSTASVTFTVAPPTGSTIRVMYGSATADTYPQTVHENVSVKPAAVRGKDIDVYVGTNAATPVFSRWTGVQSFEVTRRVTIENDEEFGNPHFVSQDFDTPEVSGNIVFRPRDPQDLIDRIQEIANVPSNEVVGTLVTTPLPVELRVSHPDTGVRLETIYIADARFTIPSVQGRVDTRLDVTMSFSGDSGQMLVYAGTR